MEKNKTHCKKQLTTYILDNEIEYKRSGAHVRLLCEKTVGESWEMFIKRIERDIAGREGWDLKCSRNWLQNNEITHA
jgi:hypothetical protein